MKADFPLDYVEEIKGVSIQVEDCVENCKVVYEGEGFSVEFAVFGEDWLYVEEEYALWD